MANRLSHFKRKEQKKLAPLTKSGNYEDNDEFVHLPKVKRVRVRDALQSKNEETSKETDELETSKYFSVAGEGIMENEKKRTTTAWSDFPQFPFVTSSLLNSLSKLSQDMALLLLNQKDCNLLVCCKDGDNLTVGCHSIILGARCPKLLEGIEPCHATDSNSPSSSPINKLKLCNYSAEATVSFLWYVYTGTFLVLGQKQEVKEEVLKLANEYDVTINEEDLIKDKRRQYSLLQKGYLEDDLVDPDNVTISGQAATTDQLHKLPMKFQSTVPLLLVPEENYTATEVADYIQYCQEKRCSSGSDKNTHRITKHGTMEEEEEGGYGHDPFNDGNDWIFENI